MKDKSRLSSTLFSFKDHREVTGSVFLDLNFLFFYCFSPPDSPRMRVSAGSCITLRISPSSLQAWHLSRGPTP